MKKLIILSALLLLSCSESTPPVKKIEGIPGTIVITSAGAEVVYGLEIAIRTGQSILPNRR